MGDSTASSVLPLQIEYVSRASTVFNGSLHRLKQASDPPIHLDFTSDVSIQFDQVKGQPIVLRLLWEPIVIITESKTLLDSIHSDGVDVRVTSDPAKATHALCPRDTVNGQVALTRGIPLVTQLWLEGLSEESGEVPKISGDRNKQRQLLLKHQHVVLVGARLLSPLIESMGGTPLLVESGEAESVMTLIRQKLKECGASSAYVVAEAPDTALLKLVEEYRGQLASKADLFKCNESVSLDIRPMKVDKVLDALKQIQQEPEKPTQRRKRRKIERASGLDFFEFSQSQVLTQASTQTSLAVKYEGETRLPDEQTKSPQLDTLTKTAGVSLPIANPFVGKSPESEATEPTTVEAEEVVSSGEDSPLPRKEPPVSQKRPSAQLEPEKRAKVSKYMLVSLVDAIKSTKQKQENMVKKELGMDLPPDIDEKLDKLAIVETVQIEFRQPQPRPVDDPAYAGRKNFKKFRKHQPASTRNYLQLKEVAPHEVNTSLYNKHADGMEKVQHKLSQDFDGLMADVRQEETLFVKEDVEEVGAAAELALDSDDSDDEPRFAFTRKT